MKLYFTSAYPTLLRNAIISMIENGDLKTWEIYEYENNKYVKHTGQWGEKGVIQLTPDDTSGKMKVTVLRFEGVHLKLDDFEGYYYGRFCELIFVNFCDYFGLISKN